MFMNVPTFLSHSQSLWGGLEPVSAVIWGSVHPDQVASLSQYKQRERERQPFMLTFTHPYLESPINQTWMSRDCGRKPALAQTEK